MSRVTLIHWHRAEAETKAELLKAMGYNVSYVWEPMSLQGAGIREDPPDAYVVDLNRMPSLGRAAGVWLRKGRRSSAKRLIYVDGAPAKMEMVRAAVPDAAFTTWPKLRTVLRKPAASAATPKALHKPSAPLGKKLGLKPGLRVLLLDAPDGFEEMLEPFSSAVSITRSPGGKVDLALAFAVWRQELVRNFRIARSRLDARGSIWLIWPKGASGVATDLNGNSVRAYGLEAGLVDYKICAVDATWTGLLFTTPRKDLKK